MITFRIANSKRCREGTSIFVSFPFDMAIVEKLRAFPTRYWDPDTKEWEVPYKDLDYLKSDFANYEYQIKREKQDLETNEITKSTETKFDIKDYKFKTKPYNYQIDGVKYGLSKEKWLLGDEQGLGKTKQAIDIACIKKQTNGYKHCLVICGVNGLKWNWRDEVYTHSHEKAHILGEKEYLNGTIKVGGNKDKIHDLDNIKNINDYFLITNVESLRSKEILDRLVKMCNNGTIDMIVADECHKMKNPQSQQGKGFLKLKSNYRLAMTGTPVMNNPLDLYIILNWLDYDKHSFYAFKNHYCMFGGFGGYEVIGYKNMKELTDTLQNLMLRRLKEEELDLPEKTRVTEYVDMTEGQWALYKEIKTGLASSLLGENSIPLTIENVLSETIRLRQVTGYTGILSDTLKESAKLDRAEEIVDDAVSNGRKVVLFSNWTSLTDEMYKRLSKKYHGAIITGEVKDEERQQNVYKFQNDEKCKFIIGTTGAMGTGLTLTAGSVEIFLDEPWNDAIKEQAEDRCHRIGQKNNLTIYTLLSKNTIDEWVHNIVLSKGDMSKLIVDGKPVTDRASLIKYLLQ